MRIAPALLALGLAIATAGCGRDPEGEGEGNNSSMPATVPEAIDLNLMEDQQNHAVPIERPSPVALTEIPAGFRGRWGMGEADCEPGRADAKGLMEVAAKTLRFYESRATLTSGEAIGEDRLQLHLSFSGEGQNWTSDQTLALVDGGRTLIRTEAKPAATNHYTRCPA